MSVQETLTDAIESVIESRSNLLDMIENGKFKKSSPCGQKIIEICKKQYISIENSLRYETEIMSKGAGLRTDEEIQLKKLRDEAVLEGAAMLFFSLRDEIDQGSI